MRGDRRELGKGRAFAWSHVLLKRSRAGGGVLEGSEVVEADIVIGIEVAHLADAAKRVDKAASP